MRTSQIRFATVKRSGRNTTSNSPRIYTHRAIIGIQVGQRPARYSPVEERGGDDPRVITWEAPRRMALRIEAFFHLHFVRGVLDYNCFSFMQYAAGLSNDTRNTYDRFYLGPSVSALRILPCQPYAMLKGGVWGRPMHGVIGFNATHSLSVVGIDEPLVIERNAYLMEGYESDTVVLVKRMFFANFG